MPPHPIFYFLFYSGTPHERIDYNRNFSGIVSSLHRLNGNACFQELLRIFGIRKRIQGKIVGQVMPEITQVNGIRGGNKIQVVW